MRLEIAKSRIVPCGLSDLISKGIRMIESNIIQLPVEDSIEATSGEIVTTVQRPLIEPGVYDITAVKHHLGPNHFGGKGKYNGKLIIDFQIVEYGDAFEVILQRYFTVKLKQKKTGKYGFTVGNRSDFYYEYRSCFPWRKNERNDRASVREFYQHIIRGQVITVEKDYKGRKLFSEDRYSKVSRLICAKEL